MEITQGHINKTLKDCVKLDLSIAEIADNIEDEVREHFQDLQVKIAKGMFAGRARILVCMDNNNYTVKTEISTGLGTIIHERDDEVIVYHEELKNEGYLNELGVYDAFFEETGREFYEASEEETSKFVEKYFDEMDLSSQFYDQFQDVAREIEREIRDFVYQNKIIEIQDYLEAQLPDADLKNVQYYYNIATDKIEVTI